MRLSQRLHKHLSQALHCVFAWQNEKFAPVKAKCGFRDWFNEGQRKAGSSVCSKRQELSPYSRNAWPGTPCQPRTEPPSLLHQNLENPKVLSNLQQFPGLPTAQTHLLENRQWFSTKKQLSHKGGRRATNLRSVRHSGPFYVSQPHQGAARAVFPSPLLHFCSHKSSPLLLSHRAANSLFHLYPAAAALALL